MKTSHKFGKIKGCLSTMKPFRDISTDVYGPIPSYVIQEGQEKDRHYLLTISDRCTRWTEVFWIGSLRANEIIEPFKQWIEKNSKPATILSDQGTMYTSAVFNKFCSDQGIKHLYSTAYNPTGNSISERQNQTITRVIKTNKKIGQTALMNKINQALQLSYNSAIDATPFELKYAKKAFEYGDKQVVQSLEKAVKVSMKASVRNEENINLSRKARQYNVGERVWRMKKVNSKFEKNWAGPFQIEETASNGNVVIIKKENLRIKTNIKIIRPMQERRLSDTF